MRSDAPVRLLMGPVGSGKTTGSLMEVVRRSKEQARSPDGLRKTRWAFVRNTRQQLKDTTLKSFLTWFPAGIAGTWRESDMTFLLRFDDVYSEILFRALDTPADEQRLLSLELTGAYINEFREFPMELIAPLRSRLGRYPPPKEVAYTWRGVIGDTNPPSEDSEWYQKMEIAVPQGWEVFKQPGGLDPGAENRANLPEDYYEQLMDGASDEWINVHVHGKYGRSVAGRPVYENSFRQEFHVAQTPLIATKSATYPLMIGMDFGRTPAAIIKQRDYRGRILTLDELTSVNMGLEKFLDTKLKPFLADKYPSNRYIIAGDPSGWYKGQLTEQHVGDILKAAGLRGVPASTNEPDRRIMAVERLLAGQVDGAAQYLIDPSCKVLIAGFKSGYKYKRKADGRYEPTPFKDDYSHPHDANQYGDLMIGLSIGESIQRKREVQKVDSRAWT